MTTKFMIIINTTKFLGVYYILILPKNTTPLYPADY